MARHQFSDAGSTSDGAIALPPLIAAGLDTLDFGFAIFDRNLKLVAWNTAFRTLRGYPAALCKPGTEIVEFYRYNADRGDYGPGDAEVAGADPPGPRTRATAARARVRAPSGQILNVRYAPIVDDGIGAHLRRHHRAQAGRSGRGAAGGGAQGRARQHAGRARVHRREPERRRLQRSLRRHVPGTERAAGAGPSLRRFPALPRRARLLRRRRRRNAGRGARAKACAIRPAIRSRTGRRRAHSRSLSPARRHRAAP